RSQVELRLHPREVLGADPGAARGWQDAPGGEPRCEGRRQRLQRRVLPPRASRPDAALQTGRSCCPQEPPARRPRTHPPPVQRRLRNAVAPRYAHAWFLSSEATSAELLSGDQRQGNAPAPSCFSSTQRRSKRCCETVGR